MVSSGEKRSQVISANRPSQHCLVAAHTVQFETAPQLSAHFSLPQHPLASTNRGARAAFMQASSQLSAVPVKIYPPKGAQAAHKAFLRRVA